MLSLNKGLAAGTRTGAWIKIPLFFFNGIVMYIDCIVTLVSKNPVFNKYMHVFVCLGEIMLSLSIYI